MLPNVGSESVRYTLLILQYRILFESNGGHLNTRLDHRALDQGIWPANCVAMFVASLAGRGSRSSQHDRYNSGMQCQCSDPLDRRLSSRNSRAHATSLYVCHHLSYGADCLF